MVHKYTRVQKNRRVYRGGEHTYYVVYYVYTLDWRRHLPNCRVQTKLCDPNQCKKPTKHIEFRRVSQMRKSKLNYSIAHWTWLLSKTKKSLKPIFHARKQRKRKKKFHLIYVRYAALYTQRLTRTPNKYFQFFYVDALQRRKRRRRWKVLIRYCLTDMQWPHRFCFSFTLISIALKNSNWQIPR